MCDNRVASISSGRDMKNHQKVFLYVFLSALILVSILSCGGGGNFRICGQSRGI